MSQFGGLVHKWKGFLMGNMTASPIEFIYREQKFSFYPLRDCDFGEFEMWVQDRIVDVTKRNIRDLPPEQQTLLLMNACDRAALVTFGSKESLQLMRSVEGAARILYLSTRKAIPLEKIRELASDPDFVAKAFQKVGYLASMATSKMLGKKKLIPTSRERKSIGLSRKSMDGPPIK